MNCRVDFGTASMMPALDAELTERRAKYTELDPRVVAVKESLEKMKAAELANCARQAGRAFEVASRKTKAPALRPALGKRLRCGANN